MWLTEAPLPEVCPRLEVSHTAVHPHTVVMDDGRVFVTCPGAVVMELDAVSKVPHLTLCKK